MMGCHLPEGDVPLIRACRGFVCRCARSLHAASGRTARAARPWRRGTCPLPRPARLDRTASRTRHLPSDCRSPLGGVGALPFRRPSVLYSRHLVHVHTALWAARIYPGRPRFPPETQRPPLSEGDRSTRASGRACYVPRDVRLARRASRGPYPLPVIPRSSIRAGVHRSPTRKAPALFQPVL